MDDKLSKAKKAAVFEDNEARTQYLVDNRCMNEAGGLFKTGLIVANCHVVTECSRRVAGIDQKKMEAAAAKKVDQSVDVLNKAKRVYEE